ncbi:MAG: ATP phosphoribosyltransferase regulatory subunit [Candidatus Eremiobacteraeota bacterium]|nr:ATP phosphoribosyltransferase regulatory subunit [Candidatus Eremiobacteraeota bacterium]
MRLPAGTRDWLPEELRRKRALENTLRGVFERWNYVEVQTPGIERFDVLEMGIGETVVGKTFLFADRGGVQLALRPEMTTPIARLVSTRLREAPLPLRLSYVQTTYRYEEPQEGRMREFTQAGLELIGPESADADAESLFSAIEALDSLGLDDARFDINHWAIADAVLRHFEVGDDAIEGCKRLVADRNLVALRALLAEHGYESAIEPLVSFATMRGGEEVLERLRPLCGTAGGREALERLGDLLRRAAERGYGKRVGVDPSMLRDFSYYTGFVFEGFIGEVGFSLCGGGRYDDLLPRFGYDAGAVGWSAGVERLLLALERRRTGRQ